MFYRPTHDATGEMWDTWLYWSEDTFYLYYLARSSDQWDNISMATSTDGMNWTESGPILRKGDGVIWMGTGSTWESPHPSALGKFQMNFSEWKGPRQTIFFATSDDLVQWQRLGDEYEFVQDERWYEPQGRWDCIWTMPRPGGGLYGYWTATPKAETGGRFGFGQSTDGVTWEALPPPKVHGVGEGEVGAIEEIDGKYYMMFGSNGRMTTLAAEKPEGPFHVTAKNPTLLAGHTYFSRFFPAPDGLLANHHSIARDGHIYMGLLKRAVLDAEGILRLGWWEGNDGLKRQRTAMEIPTADVAEPGALMLPNAFDLARGLILECRLSLPPTLFAARRGLYVECADDSGTAVLLDARGRVEFNHTDLVGSIDVVEHRTDREMTFDSPTLLRLVLEHSLMELYLDDILIECFSLPASATGRIGLLQGGDTHAFSNLIAWC